MKCVPVMVPAAVALVASIALAAQEIRRDGDWEIKMEMHVAGQIIPTTTRHCVTKEQAAEPMNTVPGGPDAQRGCKMGDYKVAGQTVTWTIACDGPPPMTTRGEYVYGPDSYVGTMTMLRAGQTITTKLAGKRLGDCTDPAAPGGGGQGGR